MIKKLVITILLVFWVISPLAVLSQESNIVPAFLKDKYPKDKASYYLFPYLYFRVHKNNRFWTTVNNNGIIGNIFDFYDEDIKSYGPSFYFPRNSHFRHGFWTGLWVGGIINGDTLVSTCIDVDYESYWNNYTSEFWPDYFPFGDFVDKSEVDNDLYNPYVSRSESIYEATFTDTFLNEYLITFNQYDGRYHKPLYVKVIQTTYSWSDRYAEDFIIIDYEIQNIGVYPIKEMYLGLYHKGGVHHLRETPAGLPPKEDDLEGFIDSIDYEFEELGKEPMNIAWVGDVDGFPQGGAWGLKSTRNCYGIAPLNIPDNTTINFNWWIQSYAGSKSWGPRRGGTYNDPVRLFHGELGMPLGDNDKYYLMAHPEIDYSGFESALSHMWDGWLQPFEYAVEISQGHQTYFVYSVGPVNLMPNKTIHYTFVHSVGENFHTDPSAFSTLFDPNNPYYYMDYLNYDDLYDNIRWAKRIYDNPGVDTDNDGDSGKYFFHIDPVSNDSIQVFYEGDGVPDFNGAKPPPAPKIRLSAENGKIIVRWNGEDVETFFDTFSLLRDFEGYRVYIARSFEENDITLLASYDRENYNRYEWDRKLSEFTLKDIPFTIEQLKELYGENFEPLQYTRVNPFYDGADRICYFTKVDYNMSELNDPLEIHKVYPDAICDSTDVDEEGRMRFYEYEFVVEDLMPTVPYYISVTAFDFGHPAKSLEPLESSRYENLTEVFAVNQGEGVMQDNKLNVYCYPNPYLIDEDYAEQGFENRFTDLPVERARSIYFANLPNKCTISIFSLDGDLVKRIEHNEPEGSGTAAVERFNLISRNYMSVTTGMYYWVVESTLGNQVGKLVIIK